MVQVCWCGGRQGERNTKYKYRYYKIRRVQVIWRLGWVGWRSGKQDEEVQRLVALTSIDLQSPILFCISRFPFLILCIATIGGLIFYWFAVFLFCASVFLLWWVRGWEAVWEIGPYRFYVLCAKWWKAMKQQNRCLICNAGQRFRISPQLSHIRSSLSSITMSVQDIFCYTALSVGSLQKYGDW